MIQQSVKGSPVPPLKGALIIAGLAVSIVLVSWVERAVALSTGFQYGSFVMAYRYTVTEGRFFIERVYGDHARIVYDIPLESVLAVGDKDEVFGRYGSAQA